MTTLRFNILAPVTAGAALRSFTRCRFTIEGGIRVPTEFRRMEPR